jgi:hypothetical protein
MRASVLTALVSDRGDDLSSAVIFAGDSLSAAVVFELSSPPLVVSAIISGNCGSCGDGNSGSLTTPNCCCFFLLVKAF